MTSVTALVRRSDTKGRRHRVTFLVDGGAIYTVLPEKVWRSLGLTASRTGEFSLPDGTIMTRSISEARFTLAGRTATSPVILGAPGDRPLLGSVTLETLGLMVNPLTREVLPMRLVLA